MFDAARLILDWSLRRWRPVSVRAASLIWFSDLDTSDTVPEQASDRPPGTEHVPVPLRWVWAIVFDDNTATVCSVGDHSQKSVRHRECDSCYRS